MSEGSTRYPTLAERTAREAERRQQAARAVMAELRLWGADNAARFIVYGSAARNAMRNDSDIDVLIDTDEDLMGAAWAKVEELGSRYDVPVDPAPYRWARPAFLARIMPGAVVLP